ncbi:DUF4383 domain-containing protein [Microbacterium betulae]|uniref:DUF4383 domain-containing protein n=1 Tax=Microbacterium betulae TaxID=2981139 RepID=A0AA97FHV6_9MICO|nr:DUF4383 domain-containing protein [Microbacterium sp. AB]WOF22595.1 DUF4383 domain-containing protein [Microbacterium sp. AB]
MSSTAERRTGYGASAVQKVSILFGVVFLLVGIAGFIPGLTSDIGAIEFASHTSGAMLLGIFQVSILHNIVHLLFGIAGLALAGSVSGARGYLVVGGIIYAVLWVYGLVVPHDHAANFVPLNGADNWLHLGLAVAMLALGLALTRGVRQRA